MEVKQHYNMKKLKTTLIVWIAIYPTITAIQYFFGEYLMAFPLAIRSLILTLILVPLMVYMLIPFWTYIYEKILRKKSVK